MEDPEEIARAPWWQYFPWTFAAKASEESDEKWKPFPTLVKLAKIAYSAVKEGNRRIIFNVHPQSGKSELFSKWFPTWYFNTFPSNNIIFATYADDYASNWGRKIRDEIQENPMVTGIGQELALKKDAQSKSEFETNHGGELIAAGTRGQVLGRGANLAIVDDPYKNWEEAQNRRVREDVEDWWEGTMQHRLLPGCTVILIHQRWHSDDFTHYLTEESEDADKWEHYSFPAFAQVDAPEYDPRDPGEPFVPIRDEEFLRDKKSSMRSVVWKTVYMQDPDDEEDLNDLFTRKDIRQNRVTPQEYPTQSRIAVGVDPPGDDNTNTSEAGIVCDGIGVDDDYYTLENASVHGSPAKWGAAAVRCYDRNEADVIVAETNQGGDMVEDTIKQQAKQMYQDGERSTKTVNVEQVKATRGKATRAEPVSALYENGRVHHVGDFEELEDQLVKWSPGDDSPDILDAHVWAMRELMQNVDSSSTASFYAR